MADGEYQILMDLARDLFGDLDDYGDFKSILSSILGIKDDKKGILLLLIIIVVLLKKKKVC